MKNMDRRLKKIIFLLITMLLTMLFLLLYTIYSYKYAYVNGNVIKADDENTFTIYEGNTYQDKKEAIGYEAGEIYPGDNILDKTYYVEVSYNGDVNLYFRIKDVVISPELNTVKKDLSIHDFLSLFDVEIVSKSINRTEHPEEPEVVDNKVPEPIKCHLNDLYRTEDQCYEPAIFNLSSKSDTDETIEYSIKISLATTVNDNFTEGFYGEEGVIANSIQGHNVQYSLEWFVDTDKPDPHHDDDDDDDHGGGHLIPETGIFGLRLTRKQTTYFYFILAILLLLAIIVYKKIKEKQEKNNGRE